MTQLDLELKLCKENFKFFLGYCYFNTYKRSFNFYKFHNDLIDILLNVQKGDRIILNAPPRIGKTEIVKHYIAWKILNNPSGTVIYVSYDQLLVNRKNAEIMDLLKWLAQRFNIPDLKMKPNSDGKSEWTNRANGAIIARGSNNALTGGGCNMLMVIDDPNKPTDRESATILESRNKVFTSTVRNRIDTWEVPIIIIQQRVSKHDLSGFLLNGGTRDEWKQYSFAAINEDGTALCPERLPLEEIETYQSDPFTYNAQYLQIPLDNIGNLFEKSKIVLGGLRPPINQMRVVISIDASGKGDIVNDYNAIAVIGTDKANYYVLEILNFRSDITVLLEECRKLRNKYPGIPMLFEMKANGNAAAQILQKEMTGILEENPTKDKVERAVKLKYLFDSNCIKFCLSGLIWGVVQEQLTSFPHGKHDDIVDALTQGVNFLENLPEHYTADTRQFMQVSGITRDLGYNPITKQQYILPNRQSKTHFIPVGRSRPVYKGGR